MQYSYRTYQVIIVKIIVEYFELNSYKRRRNTPTLPKEVNSVPKNIDKLD
jgi:hypothetical protein